MSQMKAAVYEQFGEPAKVLTMKEVPIPEPEAGEIRIQMKRSPIHNHDIMMVRGEYGSLPSLPAVGGTEAVGIVDAVGDGVEQPQVGIRVAVAGVPHTWAEYFIAPATAALPVPDSMSDESAAQLMAMPASSLMVLNKFPAKRGDWIVINAANGAVGKSVAQLAEARGIRVLSIVKRDAAKAELEALGIGPVVVSQGADWISAAQKRIDGPVVGGIDMVGGQASNDLVALLDEGATLLAFGSMSNEAMQIDTGALIFKDIKVKGFWGQREKQQTSEADMAEIVKELIGMVNDGHLQLPVHKTYDLDHVSQAGEDYYAPRDGKLMIAA